MKLARTLATSLLLANSAQAQLPTARLDAVFPPGIQLGTETEVTLQGVDLDEIDRLLTSDPGLTTVHGEGLKFKITASAATPPGLYEIRVGGRYGLSSSRLFAVGSFPEINEAPGNDTLEKAQAVTPPLTINASAGGDAADFFKFTATKGQALLISCAAQRIDSPLNAVLTVLDPAGHELASAHRTNGADPCLQFTAPSDGEFIAKVNDIVWQADPTSVYRLTIAANNAVPAEGLQAMPLSGAVCDWMQSQPSTEITTTATTDLDAHKLTLPASVNANSAPDWYEFTGAKDRKVMIDVLSHRLGNPTDLLLQVFKVTKDANGQEQREKVAEFDDTAAPPASEGLMLGSRDPTGSLVCGDNIVYRLQVTDRFNAHKPYRLQLRDPQPGFGLVAFWVSPGTKAASMQRWSPMLRKGSSALLQVAVLRRDGYEAPISLHLEGLPAGVTASDVMLPPNVATGSMIVHAAPEAQAWSGRVQVVGTAGELKVSAREAVPRWSVTNNAMERVDFRLSKDGVSLAVDEKDMSPMNVEPTDPKGYETSLAGVIEVPVKFTRSATHKGFKGEWEAVLMGLPGLRSAPVVKPAADAADAKLVLDLKRKDGNTFTPGTWSFYATARGTVKWQADDKAAVKELAEAAYSAPIQVKIEASPVMLTGTEALTVAPGAKVEWPLKLERRYGFAEGVSLELVAPAGVKGITAKFVVAKEVAETKLVIETIAETPLGVHACKLNAKCTWNGEELPWSIPLNLEVKP